ncbi:auracyanin family protein [Flectobacillus sp. BAB-3569]|uniref:auracyanin family protein n=1 Tax=Flectobacillus sp. BAB-3569 TaxID=1509483 RepID=UPI000BA3F2E7|nr:auracyanin family protein [Flectobacillus sp. BAB-3569]PAC33571.1 auracyanin family protein [Flectobacillus sp. BAB-3569]
MKRYYQLLLSLGLLGLGASSGIAQNKPKPLTEDDFYEIKTVAIPDGIRLEAGGLAPMPDGRLGVCTRRGEVWIIENPYQTNGTKPSYKLFASGLHESLGLAYRDGSFYCTQRGELTKLTDTDGDDKADLYENVANWDLSGNYHEYSYGPVFDKNGDMYLTFNVAWVGYGEGKLAKWRGWLVKVTKEGKLEPVATGLRSPAGFTVNSNGDVLFGENQGDWVGSGRVTHLEKGDFAGNAGGLYWTKEPDSPLKLTREDLPDTGEPMYEAAKKVKALKLPAVWFPHAIMGISTADMIEDETNGKFGPFQGQYIVFDQGQSKAMRMSLEKVNGKYQGACYPFREGFQSGTVRARWGNDGSIFVGMTSRGWGSTGKDLYGLQRLVWNGRLPFEMKTISARPDGFEIEFTQPVDAKTASNASSYELKSFTYKYHHNYGSPIINQEKTPLKGIIVSADRKKVRLVIDNLRKGYIHEVRPSGILNEEGQPLLHEVGYYTLNNIPDGEAAQLTEAQKVKASTTPAPSTSTPAKKTTPINGTKKVAEAGLIDSKQVAALLKKHACTSCHAEATRVVGPPFTEVAKRNYTNEQILELVYHPKPENWPDYATEMASMTHVPKADVLKIAAWINALGKKKAQADLNKLENHD